MRGSSKSPQDIIVSGARERLPSAEMEVSNSTKEEENKKMNENNNQKRREYKKTVSFAPNLTQIHPTLHLKDYTEDEINASWAQEQDFETTKREMILTLRLVQQQQERRQQEQEQQQHEYDSLLPSHCSNVLTFRGLEHHTEETSRLRKNIKKQAMSLVLGEQDRHRQLCYEKVRAKFAKRVQQRQQEQQRRRRQQQSGNDNQDDDAATRAWELKQRKQYYLHLQRCHYHHQMAAESIRKQYLLPSTHSQKAAQIVGLQDAIAVQQIIQQDQQEQQRFELSSRCSQQELLFRLFEKIHHGSRY